jgi:hypothetical protein
VWYEYLRVVFLSLTESKRAIEAQAVASGIINANRATPEGYVILGSTYAEWLLHSGQKQKAFEFFEWITKEAPTHRTAAVAHYWIALRHHISGDLTRSRAHASAARLCYAGNPALLQEWQNDAKSLWLICDLNINSLLNFLNNTYKENYMNKIYELIISDIKILESK